jgi:hypothetical protein
MNIDTGDARNSEYQMSNLTLTYCTSLKYPSLKHDLMFSIPGLLRLLSRKLRDLFSSGGMMNHHAQNKHTEATYVDSSERTACQKK